MATLFVTGLLLCASIAIPMGPVNIAMMQQTLVAKDIYSGLSIGLGATTADLTYLLLVVLLHNLANRLFFAFSVFLTDQSYRYS